VINTYNLAIYRTPSSRKESGDSAVGAGSSAGHSRGHSPNEYPYDERYGEDEEEMTMDQLFMPEEVKSVGEVSHKHGKKG
jgi:hypothetical protein